MQRQRTLQALLQFRNSLPRIIVELSIGAAALVTQVAATGAETVLYRTGFEVSEGFAPGFTLVGQSGWEGSDDSGNGLTTGFFESSGQHAFIGFSPPAAPNTSFVNLWKPLNFTPRPPTNSLVQFSVRMQVEPSTNNAKDSFRWSVYNTQPKRLFTLEFDSADFQISYLLDNTTNYVATGLSFDTLGFYDLLVSMDFRRNLWTASLNDVIIVNSKPITATGAALNLGDVDAVWELRTPSAPGNNFMVFDDYRVAVTDLPSVPATLESRGVGTNSVFILRVFGQENLNYAVEATADWVTWQSLQTLKAPAGGIFDYEDAQLRQTGQRFFRARQVP